MSGVQFRIDVISGNSAQQVQAVTSGLQEGARAATGFSDRLRQVGERAFLLNNISSALSGVVGVFNSAIQPGIDFNSSLTDMQAITGVSNEQLVELGANARQLAKDYGIDAAGAVESNKLLLSQLSPEIAKSAEGLNAMSENAAILSKQLSGDVAGATGILTTAMNQYGVSVEDPIAASKTMAEMMNIMSAAAKEGSAELPQIQSALQQSGMMAKTANVSFSELNAAIQILDKAGKKGAEGGTAIRNILAEMSQGAMNSPKTIEMLKAAGINVDSLADKSLSFSQRLGLLKPLVNDTAAMTQLFGKENVSAGVALVQNAGAMEDLTGKITGTNTATEMADTIMGSFSERMARTNAWLKDLGISIFNATEGFVPFIQMGMGGLQTMTHLGGAIQAVSIVSNTTFGSAIAKAVGGVGSLLIGMGSWITSTITATAAQWGLNIALNANPIGLLVIGIAAAVGAIAVMITWWDEISGAVVSFANWVLENNPFAWMINVVDVIFPGFKAAMSALWDWIADKFNTLFGWISDAWNWVSGLFGGGDAKAPATIAAGAPAATSGVSVQGVANTETPLVGWTPGKGKKGSKASQDAASNVTSGGARNTTINLTIHKLQDQTVINTTNFTDGAKQGADKLVQIILETLGGINPALNAG